MAEFLEVSEFAQFHKAGPERILVKKLAKASRKARGCVRRVRMPVWQSSIDAIISCLSSRGGAGDDRMIGVRVSEWTVDDTFFHLVRHHICTRVYGGVHRVAEHCLLTSNLKVSPQNNLLIMKRNFYFSVNKSCVLDQMDPLYMRAFDFLSKQTY